MRKMVLGLAESKRKDGAWTFSDIKHNTLNALNIIDNSSPTAIMPSVGGDANNRAGNDVYSTGFMVRGIISDIPWDRRNSTYRFWLVEHNTTQGTVTTYNEWFRNVTGTGLLDPVNNDRFKAKKLFDLKLDSRDRTGDSTAQTAGTIYFKRWIPFKRKLEFQSSSSQVVCNGMREKFSIVFMGYDTYASTLLDTVAGTVQFKITMHYKDP